MISNCYVGRYARLPDVTHLSRSRMGPLCNDAARMSETSSVILAGTLLGRMGNERDGHTRQAG